MHRLIFALLLAICAVPAAATPIASSSDATCTVGLHCVFTITKSGVATSYSDLVAVTSGAGAGVSQRFTLRLLKGQTTATIAVKGVAPGQFTLTLKAARYLKIGRSPGIGTVTAPAPPPPSTITCPDGQVIAAGTPCPLPPPPATQTCPDGSVIPATSVCPVAPPPPPPPPPPPAGTAVALMACQALNNGDLLVSGRSYTIVGYAGLVQPGDPPPSAGTKDIVILNDATHKGDGIFGLYVPKECVSMQ